METLDKQRLIEWIKKQMEDVPNEGHGEWGRGYVSACRMIINIIPSCCIQEEQTDDQ